MRLGRQMLLPMGLFLCAAGALSGCPEEEAPAPEPATAEATEAVASEGTPVAEQTERPRVRPTRDIGGAELGTVAEGFGVEVGAEAPDAQVEDMEGAEVTLTSVRDGGAMMLVFYRGGWCPYCNFQVRSLTEAYPQFQSRGVTPVLVSVDRVEEAARTGSTYEIPFPVLSDPDLALHRAFNVVFEADDSVVERLRSHGNDIEASSGRDHHSYAVPSVFVVDAEGKVRWAHVDPEYTVRPSVAQLVGVLDQLGFAAD